ncbi:MAG: DUF4625 domain-containing protein [Bacteroidetes bacterium]|nr:DUF4625 domain-containing protein [Bacteroidota bacterium]
MKKYKLSLLLVCFLTANILLTACNEDTNNEQDTEAPAISISSPTATETYVSGDTLQITALITDNDQLHDLGATLTRTHNDETVEVWTYSNHSHGNTYNMRETYVIEVPGMHNDFELTIWADDHNGNMGSETVSFHVME